MQLSFLSGFENTIVNSNSFTILTGSSVTGTFTGLANNSRITLPNELGSVKITYNATNVVLSDWQPVIHDLTWDPGTTDAGSQVFNVPASNVGGRFYFRITSQATAIGAWRTALRVTGGTADVYLKQNAFPVSVADYGYKSERAGTAGDGFVVPGTAFGAAQTWYLMVSAGANSQWSLVSGEAFVQDLGTLASDAISSSGNVQIGSEGYRFFKTSTPPAAAAWRVWLNDGAASPATLTGTKLAVRRTTVPFIDAAYDHQQLGHMLLVPPYLNTGGDTYFLAVSGTPGTTINLDSRSAAVTDVAFGSNTAFTLPTAGYAVYRTQVPIDQIGWQTELRGVSANVDLAVRRDNAASEWFNDAFSEVPGTVGDSVTLVPPTLSNGTYYMTIYNAGVSATGTLVNRVPFSAVPDDVAFIGTSLNDEATTSADDANPNKAGWRYFRVGVADAQGISEQLGKFGWELSLAGEPANAEIALRRNFLPGKWLSRNAFGGGGQGSTYHQDFNSATGLLQRAGHQADIWYVGVYASASALGNFSLSRTEIIPPVVPFANGSATMMAQPAGTWRYFTVEVPNDAALLGWDLRTTGVTGNIAMNLSRGGAGADFGAAEFWTHPKTSAGEFDFDRYLLKAMEPQGTGAAQLRAGTYYINIYNASSQPQSYTVQSRGIGTVASTYPLKVQPLAFANGTATFTNLPAREVAFYSVEVPAGAKTWSVKSVPDGAGELTMMGRQGILPQTSYAGGGDWLLNKPGQEMLYMGASGPSGSLVAGTYYLAVASAGTSPSNWERVGTGTASGTMSSVSEMPVTVMSGGADIGTTEQTQQVALAFGEVKLYRFTVAPGTLSLEVRLTNRTGNPLMTLAQGDYPSLTNLRYHSATEYPNSFGGPSTAGVGSDLITLVNPASGVYTVGVRAASFLDATATLGVVARVPTILNFSATQNVSGGTNVDTTITPVSDGTRSFYQVTVPPTLIGGPPLGWKLGVSTSQGAASIFVYRNTSDLSSPSAQTTERSLVLAPPVFSPGTYLIEVRAAGATSYTLTSEAVVPRNAATPWLLPTAAAYTTANDVGDSGQLDLANGDYDFYAVNVPEGNAGVIRTVIEAISGNPDLYIRRASVPSRNHTVQGIDPDQATNEIAYTRALTSGTGTEYGNWVPYDQKNETQLKPGTYYLAVHAASNTNLRYRLRVSPGAIQGLALNGGNVSNQLLTGGDWRYYKVDLPADVTMPQSWQMTFAQSSGDAIMFLRDTVPPGLKNTGTVTTYGDATMDWQREAKNANTTQYSRYDNPGSYTLTTPPLRPGTSYYVGVYAKNDSSFSLSSSTSGNIGAIPTLDFYTGTINTSIPANSSLLYRIYAPVEATRIRWTSTHVSTVQVRVEQGTLPATTGTVQHYYSSGANSFRNTVLATTWPWLPNQNYYMRIVNNAATAATVTLTMNGGNAYSEWAAGFFTTAQLANTAISGMTVDPDMDGVANLMEFLLGGNPNIFNATILPTLTTTQVSGSHTMVFRYNRKVAASGVIQLVDHSPNLSTTWTSAVNGQDGVTITTSPLDAATEQVTVTIPSVGASRFVRLRAAR